MMRMCGHTVRIKCTRDHYTLCLCDAQRQWAKVHGGFFLAASSYPIFACMSS